MNGILVILVMNQIAQNTAKMHWNHIIVLKSNITVILGIRKALNFDISDSRLKKFYPSKSYKNGWKDINKYLQRNGFLHRQYSGYVSKNIISMIDVIHIVENMSEYLNWLGYCIKEFDVTIVGNEYSLKNYINQSNIFD